MVKYINPEVDMKCKNTIVLDVEKEYIEERDKKLSRSCLNPISKRVRPKDQGLFQ